MISRSIAGTRQEIDIKSEAELKLYITREDLWNKDIIKNNNSFYNEIDIICKPGILIGHCWNLYNVLEGDKEKIDEMFERRKNRIKKEEDEDKEFEINTNSNQNNINNLNRIIERNDNEDDSEDKDEQQDISGDEDSDANEIYFS